MSLDRAKKVVGKRRRGKRLNCGYCGESTYIEKIGGRDACSYCGAGVDETFEEETDLSTHEEYVATQMLNAQIVFAEAIGDTKSALITKKVTEGGATSYHRRKKQSGGFNVKKFIPAAFIFCLILVVAPMMRNSMYMETPGDREDPSINISMVEIGLYVDLIDAETGMYNDHEARLEIVDSNGYLVHMCIFKNTALFYLIVEDSTVHRVLMFPYQNSTYSERSFMAIADETQLITFAIY